MASFLWLDRPVASFVHDHFRYPHRGVVDELSHFPNPLVLLALILSIILGLRMILGRPFSRNQANTFVCSLSVIFTEAIKNALKFIFGRTWPETWVHNNPSFIRDGVYGFHFMHGGSAYQSFPSGHMAATCAVISVLWIRYPRFRWFYLITGLLIGDGSRRRKLSLFERCHRGRFRGSLKRLVSDSNLGYVRSSRIGPLFR